MEGGDGMDRVEKISHELARVDEGQVKAYADKDRVIFMIQDAPMELRKLADALEQINVREIQALVAYKLPTPPAGEKPAPGKAEAPAPAARAAAKSDRPRKK
jgi:hypothetical protein